MFAKIAIIAFVVAAVQGSNLYGADYTSFSYGVNDPYTGDIKGQQETRLGDSVVGQYSLLDSDGTRRTVDYSADALNGFNAVVRKDPAVIASRAIIPGRIAAPAIAAPAIATPAIAAPAIAAPAFAAPAIAAPAFAAPTPYIYGGYYGYPYGYSRLY